jgi:MFS family permease
MSFTSSEPAGPPASTDRWADVYLSTIARAVSTCGDYLAAIALLIALQTRGSGGFAVAALLIAAAAPPTLLAPLAGRLADRVDSRRLLVAVSLTETAICTVLAFTTQTALLVGLVALLGCGLAITGPTLNALIPEMVSRERLPKATAIGQTASSIGMLIAPALGGLLVGQFGLRVPLLIDAGTYLAVTVAALLIRTRRGRVPAVASGHAQTQPAWSMRRDPLLRSTVIVVGIVVAAVSAVNVADVFFVRGALHGSAMSYGLLGAVWTGAMMIGAWLVVRRPLGDGGFALALLASLGGACAAVLGAATVSSVGWLVPLWAIGGAFNGGVNVSSGVLLARRVPAPVRGRAFAQFGAVANGANALGYLLAGVALVAISARSLIALSGALGLAAALAFAVPLWRAATHDQPALAPDLQPEPQPQVA